MPFGAGARGCIGRVIALTEVQITLATILQSFELRSPLVTTPIHAAITLLPTGAVPFDALPRSC
jgi:cytochrome P450